MPENFKVNGTVEANSFNVGIGTTSDSTVDFGTSVDSVLIARGTVAQRPANTVNGEWRYNTDSDVFEGRAAGAWEGMTTTTEASSIRDDAIAMAIALG